MLVTYHVQREHSVELNKAMRIAKKYGNRKKCDIRWKSDEVTQELDPFAHNHPRSENHPRVIPPLHGPILAGSVE